MLTAIKQFFSQNLAPRPDDSQEGQEHRARLAAAALLVELVRADDHFCAAERQSLLAALDRKFGLDAAEATQLITLAQTEAHQATDLYQFTSQINRGFTHAQKIRLIEELWRVAYADQMLNHHEEHLIRKVADLIHVPHPDFIAAKLRVRPE
jgi:uncharacterized tellurite resistance protein B-like protein